MTSQVLLQSMHYLYLIRYPSNVLVFLTDFSKDSISFSLFLEIVLKFMWWDHTSRRVDKLKITLYHLWLILKKIPSLQGNPCTLMENLDIFNATVFKYAVIFTEFISLKTSIFVFSNQFAKWFSKIGTITV